MKGLSPEVIAMTIFLMVCVSWAHTLFFAADPWIFLDNANFMIHEVGHFVFWPFGEFLMMLGGSLLQVLVPILFGIYFFVKKAPYAAAFCVFWVGDNIINVGRYVADSRALQLPLFGGGRHDWNWLLSEMGILGQDTVIAGGLYFVGRLLLIAGLILMAIAIVYSYRKASSSQQLSAFGS